MSTGLREFFGWVVNVDKVKIPASVEESNLSVTRLDYYEDAIGEKGTYYAVGLSLAKRHPASVIDIETRSDELYQKELNTILAHCTAGKRFTKFIEENKPKFFVFLEE